MKKHLIVFIVTILCMALVYAVEGDFANALQHCSSFTESGNVNADGVNVMTTKQILGWQSNKCVYKETVTFSGVNTCVICKFSKSQIAELASVMKAYDVLGQYSNNGDDASSVESAQNSAVVKAWNKYLQNPQVCTLSMLK